MNISVKGTNILLSEPPRQDIKDAIIVVSSLDDNPTYKTDIVKGKKKYDLPEGVTKNNMLALYLRIL